MNFDRFMPRKILVITLRRLGDVLLTTPLTRALRSRWPQSTIHALVFAGTEGILRGNPDLDGILTMPQKPTVFETLALIRRLWRDYDLALSTQTGDRPTFYAFVAGRRRIGLVAEQGGLWKRRLLTDAILANPKAHRVIDLMRLTGPLGIADSGELVPPAPAFNARCAPDQPYAILHPNPMYAYKRWHDVGWRDLARALAARGLKVIVTQGPGAEENAYLDRLWPNDDGVTRVSLDWPNLAALLSGAELFIGADTSITHLAAATGAPTIAIFGPTDPALIGPWPIGGLTKAWSSRGTIQHHGNVWIVQNPLACLPCEKLGCEGHLNSYSQCLDELSVERVLIAADQALAERKPSAVRAQS